MTPEEKIYKVLDQIENERKISPDSSLVEFKFYDNFFAAGMVSANDERKILLKLEKEGVIKLHFSAIYSEIYRMLEPDLSKRHSIQVMVLPKFEDEYKKYKKLLRRGKNYWKLWNPLWWGRNAVIFSANVFKKHILKSSVATVVLAFLAYDYSSAWKNIKWIADFLNR